MTLKPVGVASGMRIATLWSLAGAANRQLTTWPGNERVAHQRDAAEPRALQLGGGHADAVDPQAALGVDVVEQVALLDLLGVELLEVTVCRR